MEPDPSTPAPEDDDADNAELARPLADDADNAELARPLADDAEPARPHSPLEALVLLAVCLPVFWGTTQLQHVEIELVQQLAPALGVLAWILPAYVLVAKRNQDPFRVHGVLSKPQHLGSAIAVSLVVLALYVAGLATVLALTGAQRPLSPIPWGDVATRFFGDLVFVALMEEYFFRSVLQPALERPAGPRWKFLGARFGQGAVLAALLFALAHVILQPSLYRLAVFFPALWFAWLRTRTGSLLPAVVAHALANTVELACFSAFGLV